MNMRRLAMVGCSLTAGGICGSITHNLVFSSSGEPVLIGRQASQPYRLLEELGHGAYGSIHKGVNKQTREQVAVKVSPFAMASELAAMESTIEHGGHPNILALKDKFLLRDKASGNESQALVLELVSGMELFDRIVGDGPFSETDAAGVVQQLASGLHFLHSDCGLVHGDIKPENIMLVCGHDSAASVPKIIDFGSSFLLSEGSHFDTAGKILGTVAYSPPELLKNSGAGTPLDMWSLGVVIFIMLCGVHPFDPNNDRNDDQILPYVMSADFIFDDEIPLSDAAKDVIRGLLQVNPDERLTAKELLEHRWIVQCANDGTLSLSEEENNQAQSVRTARLAKFQTSQRLRSSMPPRISSVQRSIADSREELKGGAAR